MSLLAPSRAERPREGPCAAESPTFLAVRQTRHSCAAAWIPGFVVLTLLLAAQTAGAQPVRRIPRESIERITGGRAVEGTVKVVTPEGSATSEVRNDAIDLRRGEFALLRTAQAARAVAGPSGDLPVEPGQPAPEPDQPYFTTDLRFVTPDATLSGEWVLRPIFKVANRLRWEPEEGVFRGAFFLAIEDSLRRNESRPLPTPLRFQLIAEADGVEPAELAFEHTNFPLRRVDVTARSVSDSLRVQLVSEVDVNGSDIWLPVVPYLEIETRPRVQGWGVETARVTVRRMGTTSATPTMVSLTTSSGDLDPYDVEVGAAGTGSSVLRSAGAGEAVLTATVPGLGEATTTIVFVWPWVFLLAALLGGLFGGAAVAAQERKGAEKVSWGASAVKGLLVGVLAALAWYALGVNLLNLDLGVPRQNELAVFALAALAGFFGVPRMKMPGKEGGA